jgi:hypothetical protein
MAGNEEGRVRKTLGMVLVVVGIAADVVGIFGAVGDWGAKKTEVVLAAEVTDTTAAGAAGTTAAVPDTTAAPKTTTAPAPTTTVGPAETPEQFLTALGNGLATGDVDWLYSRLHPEVVKRYGETTCRAWLATLKDPASKFTVTSVGGVANYKWVTDGLSSDIPGTTSVDVVRTTSADELSLTVHITAIDNQFHWFTACADPVAPS